MSTRDLVDECAQRSLPVAGDRVAMITRLVEHDREVRTDIANLTVNFDSVFGDLDCAKFVAQLCAEAERRRSEEAIILETKIMTASFEFDTNNEADELLYDLMIMSARFKYEEGISAVSTWFSKSLADGWPLTTSRNPNDQIEIMPGVASSASATASSVPDVTSATEKSVWSRLKASPSLDISSMSELTVIRSHLPRIILSQRQPHPRSDLRRQLLISPHHRPRIQAQNLVLIST